MMSKAKNQTEKLAHEYSVGWPNLYFIKPHKAFMILATFADESYDEKKKPTAIVVAGWMTKETEWERFCKNWQSVLDEYKVKDGFHFVEFAQKKHKNYKETPYEDWDESKKENFLVSLALTACECGFPVGGAYSAESLTQNSIKTAYLTFFKSVAITAKAVGKEGDKFKFVFDSNKDEKWIVPRHRAMCESFGKEMPFKSGFIQEDQKEFLHLQAADLYAYAMRQNAERFYAKDKKAEQPRFLDLVLEKNRTDYFNGADFSRDKWMRLMCLVFEHKKQWKKSNPKGVYHPLEHCPFLKKDAQIKDHTTAELRFAAKQFYQSLTKIWRA